MADAQPNKSWEDRMIGILTDAFPDGCPHETYRTLMTTAVEIKAVKLKILLGRCYEIIELSKHADVPANPDDDLGKEILEALK